MSLIGWAAAGVLCGLLVAVVVLCFRAPAYAFALSLTLFSLEGSFKVLLDVGGAAWPAATGAAALDFALFASLIALLASDRGRSPARVWTAATTLERALAIALCGWLVLSVLQIPVSGNLVDAMEGARVTQSYVVVALGGLVLAARLGEDRVVQILLGVILLAVAYAALRGIIGPAHAEQAYADERITNASFNDLGRNTGSFTAPMGMVSFLVPAAVLCLSLALMRARQRALALALFALTMIGIIASYVRTAPFAVVLGAALLTVLLVAVPGDARRRGALTLAVAALVLAGGYAGTLIAGKANPATAWRAKALSHPLSDYSVTTRIDHWGDTLARVADEPFGSGIGTVGRATVHGRRAVFTDNSYLKVLREQGIAGGLLFLLGVGGIVIAVGVRLVRQDPLRSPLGAAALVASCGFLALMVMAEYIEQPGKVLAWTLLGVAVWETIGRSAVERDQLPGDWIDAAQPEAVTPPAQIAPTR